LVHTTLFFWATSTAVALSLFFLARRKQSTRENVRALDRCALAALLGAGLMTEYIVGAFTRSLSIIARHERGVDLPIMFAAWAGLIIGPAALVSSARLVPPWKTSARVNAPRVLFAVSWALAAVATVFDALYI
jgi:hypothetical protein